MHTLDEVAYVIAIKRMNTSAERNKTRKRKRKKKKKRHEVACVIAVLLATEGIKEIALQGRF